MQFEYCGLDKTAEKVEIFPECEAKINLPLNCQKDPFDLKPNEKIRALNLLKFRDVFISSEGALFKGLSISEESLFHEGVKKFYQKNSDKFKFFKRNYLKRPTIKVPKAMLAFDPWSLINYYHWLCDSMMRVAAGVKFLEDDAVLILPYDKHSIKSEIILDCLKAFGISENKILKLKKNQKVKVSELLMPSHTTQIGAIYFREELLNLVRDKIINFYANSAKTNLGSRIYISRSKAAYRKISNEDEVIKLLKKYDFTIVNMEDYSFADQISISNQASCLISCHGAGLANILFMQKNSFVLELINENLIRPHFYILASGASVNYLQRKCQQTSQKNFEENADITVDIAGLEADLQIMITN